jgi:hypothetical protein
MFAFAVSHDYEGDDLLQKLRAYIVPIVKGHLEDV